MIRTAARPRVLIVGAGLAGTATAIRLLCFAREPLEIILLERRPDYRSAGVAYHRDGNPWDHVFNIQAGRMSAFREDVLDFVHWANREADRRDWPPQWAAYAFVEHSPAPRRIFQDYLTDRLAHARREACPGVVLVEADGEAVDIDVHADGLEVTVRLPEDGGDHGDHGDRRDGGGAGGTQPTMTVCADHVVLATGLELKRPPYAADVAEHPSFIRHPYSAAGIRRLETLPAESSVAIVGSVLSAYDSAALLLRQGHRGRIRLISSTGTMFRTYPEGHEHGVLRLPCPEALLKPYQGREEFVIRIRTEWQSACAEVVREHPDIHPQVVAERVAKAWEPYLPAVMDKIPSAELRGLLDGFSTVIAAQRVSAVEYTTSIIDRAMNSADPQLELVVGKVEQIVPAEEDRLAVVVTGTGGRHLVEADLVVANFAREPDYRKVAHPLWTSLLRKGLSAPHARTGRGVEVDEHGTLLGPDALPAGPISAVGVLREGDEIVRNGRTGAFAFNLAAIKNQSIAVAAHVIEQLTQLTQFTQFTQSTRRAAGPGGRTAPTARIIGNVEQAVGSGLEEAVVLEVRRLATRTRRERELLGSRLDSYLESVGALPTLPMDDAATVSQRDTLVRVIVNRAAVARLTDVSVTPRQLRRVLGLAGADDPED